MYLNYAEFLLFIIGFYALIKHKSRFKELKITFMYLTIGVLLFMVAWFPILFDHDYYMIPSLPLLVGISTVGIFWIRENFSCGEHHKFWLFLSGVLIITVPILGSVRALERYERGLRDTPYEQIVLEVHLSQVMPDTEALIMITDESKSIKLYYANRNRWNIPGNISIDTFNDIINNGAKYLISDSRTFENRKEIKNKIRLLSSYYSYNIYELVEKQD